MQRIALSLEADTVVEACAQIEHQLGQRPHQPCPVLTRTVKGVALLLCLRLRCRLLCVPERLPRSQTQFAVQGVSTAAVIVLRCTDISPIALHHLSVERRSLFEKLREQVAPEVERSVGDALHRPGGEYVDARVHQVRHHLRPVRFFDEAADISFSVRHREAVAQRRLFRREGKGGKRLVFLMDAHQKPQVIVAGSIGGDDKEVLVPVEIPAVFHAARRAEIVRLDAVLEFHPVFSPVAEMGHDFSCPVMQRRADLRIAVTAQQLDNMLHHRSAQDRRHGLRVLPRDGTQPHPQAARKDHCFHCFSSRVLIFVCIIAHSVHFMIVNRREIWYNETSYYGNVCAYYAEEGVSA